MNWQFQCWPTTGFSIFDFGKKWRVVCVLIFLKFILYFDSACWLSFFISKRYLYVVFDIDKASCVFFLFVKKDLKTVKCNGTSNFWKSRCSYFLFRNFFNLLRPYITKIFIWKPLFYNKWICNNVFNRKKFSISSDFIYFSGELMWRQRCLLKQRTVLKLQVAWAKTNANRFRHIHRLVQRKTWTGLTLATRFLQSFLNWRHTLADFWLLKRYIFVDVKLLLQGLFTSYNAEWI